MLFTCLKFVDATLQCIDQLVAVCRAALQRIDPLQQLFHGRFLLLRGGRLRLNRTREHRNGHNAAKRTECLHLLASGRDAERR